jgi:hypothetical protein
MGIADNGEQLSDLRRHIHILEEQSTDSSTVPPNVKFAVLGLTIPVIILDGMPMPSAQSHGFL